MSEEKQEKQSSVGKHMFVESLMTRDEWTRRMKVYPSSTKRWDEVNIGATNSFKWRFGMGNTLSSSEIGNINGNLDYLRKKLNHDNT